MEYQTQLIFTMKSKTRIIVMPYTIQRDVGLSDTISIGGWGNFHEVSRTLDECEAAILAGILLNFLNKKDLDEKQQNKTEAFSSC